MLDQAYSAFQNKDYSSAIEILTKLKKESDLSPKAHVLLLLCSYQAGSSAELLEKNANNPITIQKIATRSDWKELANSLPSDQSEYVSDVMEYCALSLGLSGNADKVLEAQQSAASGQSSSVVNSVIDYFDESSAPAAPSGPNPALFVLAAGTPQGTTTRNGLRSGGGLPYPAKKKKNETILVRAANTPYGAMHKPSGKTGTSDNSLLLINALTQLKNENPGQDEMAARKSALKEKIDALEQSILSGNS